MWAERMRQDWQHSSTISAHAAQSKKVTPDKINPMENGGKSHSGTSVALNSAEGFAQLSTVARSWRGN